MVERVLRKFLKCGLLEHGFARLWCGECRRSVLVAFSCRGRSFCPSCEKKKQLLWAGWLRQEVLAEVTHRHLVLTIPRLLRPLLRRRDVDPLLCTRCGQRMSIVACITDAFSIRRILDHLGLSPPEADKPPPPREVLRVAEHGEGWGVPAQWE